AGGDGIDVDFGLAQRVAHPRKHAGSVFQKYGELFGDLHSSKANAESGRRNVVVLGVRLGRVPFSTFEWVACQFSPGKRQPIRLRVVWKRFLFAGCVGGSWF